MQEEKRGRESARFRADLHPSHISVQSSALGHVGGMGAIHGRTLGPLDLLELQDRQLAQQQEAQKAAAAQQVASLIRDCIVCLQRFKSAGCGRPRLTASF